MSFRRKLLWLLFLPLQVVAALAYLENNSDIQFPPISSNACIDNPDPDNFLIRYTNPECLPKWRFWFRDPVFNALGIGTERVQRITDVLSNGMKGASHVYSSVNAFNQGMTKMIIAHRLLQGGDAVAIYDLASGTYSMMPPGASVSWQPRWSRTDPNIVYVMPPASLPGPVYIKQYDISTGVLSNVGGPLSFNGHTYDSTVSHPAEDDICFGGDHLIKRVRWQGMEYVVVFSISQQAVVGEYAMTGLATGDVLDSVELAPAATAADRIADRNDIVLLNFAKHESSSTSFNTWGRGIWKFTFDESRPPAERMFANQQAVTASSHHDIGMDDDGSPILVTPNGSMYNALSGCQGGGKYGIEKIPLINPDGNLPTAQRSSSRCLMNALDWTTLAVHVSLGDKAGWAYLNVYRPSSTDTPSNPDSLANWKPFYNEIIQVKLDGAAVRRLAHARARLTNQWYNQPIASVSRDGRTLAFVSNFGYGNYDVTQYNDVYLIHPIDLGDVPEPTWTRVEQINSAVTWAGNWSNSSSSLHSGGTARRTRGPANRSTFSFTGTAARWIGYNDQNTGIAKVYVDGVLQTQVDTYASSSRPQQINYTTPVLPPGPHTLVIETAGDKNPSSRNLWIFIDAFEYTLTLD